MSICNDCKNWQECPAVPEWFMPADIRFCPYQIRWLLEHLATLEAGRWPRSPGESGYVDMPTMKNYSHAYFETPVQMAGEVRWRIEQCGKDGRLAIAHLAWAYDLDTLADLMGSTARNLTRRVNRAVRYASGWRRRRDRQGKLLPYKDFIQHRKTAKSDN